MSYLTAQSQDQLREQLFSLMDEVVHRLKIEPDVDAFLDKTELFNEWEKILPEAEYPIFVMAVLNNIRRDSVIDSILNAIHNQKDSLNNSNQSKKETEPLAPQPGDHPFS